MNGDSPSLITCPAEPTVSEVVLMVDSTVGQLQQRAAERHASGRRVKALLGTGYTTQEQRAVSGTQVCVTSTETEFF